MLSIKDNFRPWGIVKKKPCDLCHKNHDHAFSWALVLCHPLPGLPDHALPVMNQDRTDHNTKPMEQWCIATVAWSILLYDVITRRWWILKWWMSGLPCTSGRWTSFCTQDFIETNVGCRKNSHCVCSSCTFGSEKCAYSHFNPFPMPLQIQHNYFCLGLNV